MFSGDEFGIKRNYYNLTDMIEYNTWNPIKTIFDFRNEIETFRNLHAIETNLVLVGKHVSYLNELSIRYAYQLQFESYTNIIIINGANSTTFLKDMCYLMNRMKLGRCRKSEMDLFRSLYTVFRCLETKPVLVIVKFASHNEEYLRAFRPVIDLNENIKVIFTSNDYKWDLNKYGMIVVNGLETFRIINESERLGYTERVLSNAIKDKFRHMLIEYEEDD